MSPFDFRRVFLWCHASKTVQQLQTKYNGKKVIDEPAMTNSALVLTTIADEAAAENLARTLVDERLAACVNVLPPMISFFRWKDQIERESERQLVIKTSVDRLPQLERRLHELHPYEVPEFLVLNVNGGSATYLAWVSSETRAFDER
jgi:periplasmic divalent cation tolerance protein